MNCMNCICFRVYGYEGSHPSGKSLDGADSSANEVEDEEQLSLPLDLHYGASRICFPGVTFAFANPKSLSA